MSFWKLVLAIALGVYFGKVIMNFVTMMAMWFKLYKDLDDKINA